MNDKIKKLKAEYEGCYTKSQLALLLAIHDVMWEHNAPASSITQTEKKKDGD